LSPQFSWSSCAFVGELVVITNIWKHSVLSPTSWMVSTYTPYEAYYMAYISHSGLAEPDPFSKSPVQQVSYLYPSSLEIAGSSSTTPRATTPRATTPLAYTHASPSKLVVLNHPTDNLPPAVPLASTTRPPKVLGSGTRRPTSVTSLIPPPPNNGQLTDDGAPLIFQLCHVPSADITRVVAAMSGGDQPTIKEAQLLGRLHSLKVSQCN
jgi:hypothetical protein